MHGRNQPSAGVGNEKLFTPKKGFLPLCPLSRGRAHFYGKISKNRVLLDWEGHVPTVSPSSTLVTESVFSE